MNIQELKKSIRAALFKNDYAAVYDTLAEAFDVETLSVAGANSKIVAAGLAPRNFPDVKTEYYETIGEARDLAFADAGYLQYIFKEIAEEEKLAETLLAEAAEQEKELLSALRFGVEMLELIKTGFKNRKNDGALALVISELVLAIKKADGEG